MLMDKKQKLLPWLCSAHPEARWKVSGCSGREQVRGCADDAALQPHPTGSLRVREKEVLGTADAK